MLRWAPAVGLLVLLQAPAGQPAAAGFVAPSFEGGVVHGRLEVPRTLTQKYLEVLVYRAEFGPTIPAFRWTLTDWALALNLAGGTYPFEIDMRVLEPGVTYWMELKPSDGKPVARRSFSIPLARYRSEGWQGAASFQFSDVALKPSSVSFAGTYDTYPTLAGYQLYETRIFPDKLTLSDLDWRRNQDGRYGFHDRAPGLGAFAAGVLYVYADGLIAARRPYRTWLF